MNTIKITVLTLATLITCHQPIFSMETKACVDYAQQLVCSGSKNLQELSDKDYDAMALDLINKYSPDAIKSCRDDIKSNPGSIKKTDVGGRASALNTSLCERAILKTFNLALTKLDAGDKLARKNTLKYRANPRGR